MRVFKPKSVVYFIEWVSDFQEWVIVKNNWLRAMTYQLSYTKEWKEYTSNKYHNSIFDSKEEVIKVLIARAKNDNIRAKERLLDIKDNIKIRSKRIKELDKLIK